MSNAPPKSPSHPPTIDELRRIRRAVQGVGATGHMMLGALILLLAPPAQYGMDDAHRIGGLFILIGVLQKLWTIGKFFSKE